MFRDMRNTDISETKRLDTSPPNEDRLIESLYTLLQERLPATWQVHLARTAPERPEDIYNGELTVQAADGTTGEVALLVKSLTTDFNGFLFLVTLARAYRKASRKAPEQWLLLAPYLAPALREKLMESGISYADATGNLRIALERPAVFIEQAGASANPWRDNQPLRSLKGRGAGRAVRALCDFRPPYGIRELAERANTPAPTLSRVVTLLEQETLLKRDATGGIAEFQWPQVLRRWTQDYHLTTSNNIQTCLEPRGLDTLLKKLKGADWLYAVTGSLAAIRVAPVASPRLAALYVSDLGEAAEQLGLRKAERGGNVLLAEPFDPVVYERTRQEDGIMYAAFSQVAADLLTSPGRGPEEAEELLKWMEAHEDAWRV
jgi:hypothetical protein